MAKRRKEKDEDEDKPFKIPKFDEEAFLKRERIHIKAAFIAFLFGVLMGLICFGFWALMGSSESLRWPLVFFVAVVYMFSIRYFFLRFNIDVTEFTKGKLTVVNPLNCHFCNACTEVCPEGISVKESESDFIFTIESWGQLDPKDMVKEALTRLGKKSDEFAKLLK